MHVHCIVQWTISRSFCEFVCAYEMASVRPSFNEILSSSKDSGLFIIICIMLNPYTTCAAEPQVEIVCITCTHVYICAVEPF